MPGLYLDKGTFYKTKIRRFRINLSGKLIKICLKKQNLNLKCQNIGACTMSSSNPTIRQKATSFSHFNTVWQYLDI